MNKFVHNKDLNDIAHEWDTLCQDRARLIIDKNDYSLIGVTSPAIINKLSQYVNSQKNKKILDVGCGTGYLSHELSKVFSSVVGIDISAKSIDVANSLYHANNLTFQVSSIQNYKHSERFDFCTANMVFMTDPHMGNSLNTIKSLLGPSGVLVFTITHPCFWPKYWKYEDEDWFQYNKEIFIESDFSTSLSPNIGKTTHIHRSLEKYCSIICESGFTIDSIIEPYPITTPPKNYKYPYPRFLLFSCKKN